MQAAAATAIVRYKLPMDNSSVY